MKEKSSLKIIQQNVKTCKKCELCDTRSNAVPGIGNENADVVFIGEAPGKNEDLCGEPFIGTAGKRLDDALENAGLARSSVYITNIVKCRPPNNRVPNDIEKTMCSNYLEAELQIINPKIIGITKDPENDDASSANANWYVMWNEHVKLGTGITGT